MKRLLLTTLLTLPAMLALTATANAQCAGGGDCGAAATGHAPQGYQYHQEPAHPHFPPFGCGGYCIGVFSRIHFHGPLYNYGPYTGYYPFEPYGPWTSDLRYNPPISEHGHGWERGGGLGWGHYAIATLKNVFHRVNPLAHKCGNSLALGSCGNSLALGSCGGHAKHGYAVSTSVPAPTIGCATPALQPIPPAPPVVAPPVAMPPADAATKLPDATGVLTGQRKEPR